MHDHKHRAGKNAHAPLPAVVSVTSWGSCTRKVLVCVRTPPSGGSSGAVRTAALRVRGVAGGATVGLASCARGAGWMGSPGHAAAKEG